MATATEKPTKKVARPKIHQTQCFIGGKWLPAASGKTFDTIHPATEEVIAQVAEGDKARHRSGRRCGPGSIRWG